MLGVLFVATAFTGSIWFFNQIDIRKSGYKVLLWRMHIFQVAFIGLLAVDTRTAAEFVTAYVFFTLATVVVLAFTHQTWNRAEFIRIGRAVGLMTVGFVVPFEVFVHQPHQPWSLLTYLIVIVAFTYVPYLNRSLRNFDARIRSAAQADLVGHERKVRNNRRKEWLARR
jgi:hypothetical protein